MTFLQLFAAIVGGYLLGRSTSELQQYGPAVIKKATVAVIVALILVIFGSVGPHTP